MTSRYWVDLAKFDAVGNLTDGICHGATELCGRDDDQLVVARFERDGWQECAIEWFERNHREWAEDIRGHLDSRILSVWMRDLEDGGYELAVLAEKA